MNCITLEAWSLDELRANSVVCSTRTDTVEGCGHSDTIGSKAASAVAIDKCIAVQHRYYMISWTKHIIH